MNKIQEAGSQVIKILILACIVVLGIGLAQWIMRQPSGSPIILQPPPTLGPIVVHVSGAVLQPGVYSVPYGSRVRDALQAAGGPAEDANLDSLNLAALLDDGQRIKVAAQLPTPSAPNFDERTTGMPLEITFPLDINQADATALELLPEIGPVTASNIVDYREKNGPFATIEAIQDVPGIGPKTYEAIRDLIIVNP